MKDSLAKSPRPLSTRVNYGERTAHLSPGVFDDRKTSDFRSMAQFWRGYGALKQAKSIPSNNAAPLERLIRLPGRTERRMFPFEGLRRACQNYQH